MNSEEITKTLVGNTSDGAVLSFGLESADEAVHEANWLNCDSKQLIKAIKLINKYGVQRGERGLPKFLDLISLLVLMERQNTRIKKYRLVKQHKESRTCYLEE